eukprot:COSAG06_NODE_6397_length_2948_cov_3.873289_6_plen_99_part_01
MPIAMQSIWSAEAAVATPARSLALTAALGGILRSVCRVAYFQLGEFAAACRSFAAAAELESSRTTNMWLRKARAELEGAARAPSSLLFCQLHFPLCASH